MVCLCTCLKNFDMADTFSPFSFFGYEKTVLDMAATVRHGVRARAVGPRPRS